MESIGQILKAARERRQISIADVVAATKMSSTFVAALEADNFNALVAPVYARGFIKLYAVCVGLDPIPLLKTFDLSVQAAPEFVPSPRKTSVARPEKLAPKPDTAKAGSPTVLASAPVSMSRRSPSWLASLRAGQLSTLNQLFSVRARLSKFKLPGKMLPCFRLPGIVWRRMIIVLFGFLLIIAASLAWECAHRGPSSNPDACRWVTDPPAPYIDMEVRAPVAGR